MKLTCGKASLILDYRANSLILQLPVLSESRKAAEELINEGADKLTVEAKKWRKARSLDANAYMWALIGKLSEVTGAGRDEIYRSAIKDIGGNHEVVCVINEAADKLCNAWQDKGLGWVTERTPSKLEGCTNVLLYYGSSAYDTKQMSHLIDHIVQDCEAVGIETKTPDEIANLISLWGCAER